MFVPKAFVLCDMISHFTFLFGAYNLISLFIEYVGGESNFIQQCPDDAFILRTPPCCCCCLCCHPMIVTKGRFTFIRLLLAQFILIQGVVFVALNVIYIESSVSVKNRFNRSSVSTEECSKINRRNQLIPVIRLGFPGSLQPSVSLLCTNLCHFDPVWSMGIEYYNADDGTEIPWAEPSRQVFIVAARVDVQQIATDHWNGCCGEREFWLSVSINDGRL